MSFYRDVYLKSEDWKNLRAAAIAVKAPDGRCHCCGKKKPLDVHHLQYKNLYDVRVRDLIPVCRSCHDAAHKLLVDHPEWKELYPRQCWSKILQALSPVAKAGAQRRKLMREIQGAHQSANSFKRKIEKMQAKVREWLARAAEYERLLEDLNAGKDIQVALT